MNKQIATTATFARNDLLPCANRQIIRPRATSHYNTTISFVKTRMDNLNIDAHARALSCIHTSWRRGSIALCAALSALILIAGCNNGFTEAQGPSEYTITFDMDGGSLSTQTRTVRNGGSLSATKMPDIPSKADHTFGGWYTGRNGVGSVFTKDTPVDADITVYAKWLRGALPLNLSFAAALSWIESNAQDGGYYSITVTANEDILPSTLSYNGKKVNILLKADTARTISLHSTGSLFTLGDGVTLTLTENVVLKGLKENIAALVRVNSGGALVMEAGSKITENKNTSSDDSANGGGVAVLDGGVFTMNGGEISDSLAPGCGGGVFVYGGEFTMNGGTISGNVTSMGGGVYVGNGTFTLAGGALSGNSASAGAGMYVGYRGKFIISGGEVSGNTASGIGGGGVYMNGGELAMSGGSISGNTTSGIGGGGVYMHSGAFTISGGSINGNKANGYGGGVYVYTGTFSKQVGGTIYGSEASSLANNAGGGDDYGHAVYFYNGKYPRNETIGSGLILNETGEWTPAEMPPDLSLTDALAWLKENAVDGGAYTIPLSGNESIDPELLSYDGKRVRITLSGDSDARVSLSGKGSLFTVGSGVELTLGANVTLQGLSDNTAALVQVESGGTLSMESGSTISGNTNTSGDGGGVSVDDGGTFTKSGGTIYGANESDATLKNSAGSGSAVYVDGSPVKQRNDTAGANDDLDSAKRASEGGGWEAASSTFETSLNTLNDLQLSASPNLGTPLFLGMSVDFTVVNGYNSYQWYWDGEEISGATSHTYTLQATAAGVYELSVNTFLDGKKYSARQQISIATQ